MKKKLLSAEQAFQALFVFLEAYEQRTVGTAELADVLGNIQLDEVDGRPADPAAWSDWVAAITTVLEAPAGVEESASARRTIR
jgi:hypothetical protein